MAIEATRPSRAMFRIRARLLAIGTVINHTSPFYPPLTPPNFSPSWNTVHSPFNRSATIVAE